MSLELLWIANGILVPLVSKGLEKIKNLAILLLELLTCIQTILYIVSDFISTSTLDTCLVILSVFLLNWVHLFGVQW